jgi:hypothetical protein
MDKLNEAMPTIKFPDKDFLDLPLQDQMKQIAGLIALGYLAKPQLEAKLDQMKTKYGGVDIDIDNLADMLRSGAMDLDSLCKMVPNVQTQGVNLEVKGIPTSFPNIDPVAILRGGSLPPMPKVGDVYIKPTIKAKEQADDFLNLELPTFF